MTGRTVDIQNTKYMNPERGGQHGNTVYTALGDGGSYSLTYTETWGYDLSGTLGIGLIKALISSQLGIGVSKEWSAPSSVTCQVNQNSPVLCLWSQHEYLWINTHDRVCTSGLPPIVCSQWADDTHADIPMNAGTARNYGCSTGYSNYQSC
ncbi:hypothetical protein V1509DRAFT_496481 [Lipomyces kononenkoae]